MLPSLGWRLFWPPFPFWVQTLDLLTMLVPQPVDCVRPFGVRDQHRVVVHMMAEVVRHLWPLAALTHLSPELPWQVRDWALGISMAFEGR